MAVIYSSCTDLALNCSVYTNPERTTAAANGYYLYADNKYFYVTNGVITSFGNNCATAHTLKYSPTSCADACNNPTSISTYYSLCQTLAPGCLLYSNALFSDWPPDGYYSTSSTCFTILSDYSNYDGQYAPAPNFVYGSLIIDSSACPPSCPSLGTYAYVSCEYIPQYGCVGDVDYYHDGSCGYYSQPRGYCGCY